MHPIFKFTNLQYSPMLYHTLGSAPMSAFTESMAALMANMTEHDISMDGSPVALEPRTPSGLLPVL